MKKLLVLFASAALVLSTAAVSMAAATVTGDLRLNLYNDESFADSTFGETDLRIKVAGNVTDSVFVSANLKLAETNNAGWNAATSTTTAAGSVYTTTTVNNGAIWDEIYATVAKDWGTVKMGYYEYGFTPSRVELSSSGLKNTPKNDTTFEVDIPLAGIAEGLSVDGVLIPYSTSTTGNGSYAMSANYKAENWGIKASYWNLQKVNNVSRDLKAIDFYYMATENIKLFVDATDDSNNTGAAGQVYDEGFDPIVGINWTGIADTKLNASFEYAMNDRHAVTGDWTAYYLTASYKLDNGINLVYHHAAVGNEQTKDMLRIQYQF